MKRTYNPELIFDGDTFVGINLGADHCSEHEGGIPDINKAFGMNAEAIGIERYQNTCVPSGRWTKLETTKFTYNKTPWVGLYFNADHFSLKDYKIKEYLPMPWDRTEDTMATAWDRESFGIVVHKSKKWVIDELMTAIQNHDLAIGIGSVLNPFDRGGLILMIVSRVSQEVKDAIMEDHIAYNKLMQAVADTGIEELLKQHNKRWYALMPHWCDDTFETIVETKYNVVFFLNPWERHKYNYGWFTVEELQAWTREEGPVCKN